jgi:uncharacterized protein YndB with AHSA1/START domain
MTQVAKISPIRTSDRIEQSVVVRAPRARVWKALTDHEQFGAWFRVKLDQPFAPGQPSTGHITHPGYEHVKWTAWVERIEPQTLFSFRWRPYAIDPKVDYSKEPTTLVEFTLEDDAGGGTRVTVVESGFDKVPAHRRDEAFRMNSQGWAAQMNNITAYVDGAR